MLRKFRKFIKIKAFQIFWLFSNNTFWHFCEYSIGSDETLIPAEIDSSLKYIRHTYRVIGSNETKTQIEPFTAPYELHSIEGVVLE